MSVQMTQVDCGISHTAVLSEEGEVYTFGGGGQENFGQLGHGDTLVAVVPTRVEGLLRHKVRLIACGGYHTIAVTGHEISHSPFHPITS